MKRTVTLLVRVLIATVLTFATHFAVFIVCWTFRDPLFGLIDFGIRNVVDASGPSVPSATQALLSVAFATAVLLSSPFIIAFWMLIVFGPSTRKYKILVVFSSIGLAAAGTALGYFVLFPLAVNFTGWGEAQGFLAPEPLINLLLRVVVGSAIAFQIIPGLLALRSRNTRGGYATG